MNTGQIDDATFGELLIGVAYYCGPKALALHVISYDMALSIKSLEDEEISDIIRKMKANAGTSYEITKTKFPLVYAMATRAK